LDEKHLPAVHVFDQVASKVSILFIIFFSDVIWQIFSDVGVKAIIIVLFEINIRMLEREQFTEGEVAKQK